MFGLGPTPLDVRLVAFRIPIRVHPSFWLGAAFLGRNAGGYDHVFLLVICVFVSVLIHELGHAFCAEVFDWPSEILLYFMGGLTFSHHRQNDVPWRNIAVSFMGPAAGFLFYGLILIVERILNLNRIWMDEYRFFLFGNLKFINLYWGLVNLLPVLPLDGGQIFQSFCVWLRVRDSAGIAMKCGAVVGGAVSFYFFKTESQFAGMLFLMLCLQNVGQLQSRRR